MVPQPLGQAQQGQGAVNSGGGPSTASKSNNWSKLFVKNIPDDVPDEFIEGLLGKCGKIDSWKRNKDEKGKQCDFGFVEFSAVEEAMRCIRLLNEFEILAIKL
jgi:RNA-binding protein 25